MSTMSSIFVNVLENSTIHFIEDLLHWPKTGKAVECF
jgi:hypothetical protein